MEEQEQQIEIPKPAKAGFRKQYGVILAILIGAWIIGMSIIMGSLLIVRHLNNTVIGTQNQKVDIALTDKDPVLGNKDAPVTVVEYADFQCPFCKEFQDIIFPGFKTSYIDSGQIKFVFKNYSFLGQESFDAAEAAKCAQDQNKFWEYHDLLYASQSAENSGAFKVDNLKKFATSLGLDQNKFNQCVDSRTHKDEVANEVPLGSSYGVGSTPTIFINGTMYEGLMSQAQYQTHIEEALKAAAQKNGGVVNWFKSLFQSEK